MSDFSGPNITKGTLFAGGLTLSALLSYFFLFAESPTLLFASIILFALVIVMFLRPTLGVPALIIVRPLVDSIGEYRFSVGSVGINVAGALSVIAIGWGCWRLIRVRAHLWDFELFRSILLFTLISIISFSYSWAPGATLTEILRILSFFVLYLVTRATVTDWPAFRQVAIAFLLSMVMPVLVGYYQVLTHTGLTFAESSNRAYGTFGHPNVLAFYLVLGLSFTMSVWPLLALRIRSRWPIIGLLGIMLILTFTRGAWVGLIVSLGIISYMRFRRYFFAGLMALAVMIAILPTVNIVTTSVMNLDLRTVPGAKEIIARQADQSSYQWRLDVWTEMSQRFYERPIFGFGLGAFPAVRQLQVFDFFQGVGAHNDYLRLLIELGVLGIGAYLAFLISIFVHLGRTVRRLGSHPISLPVLSLIGFSAAFVLMSAFDNLLQSTPVMWAYMILLGAVLNLVPNTKKAARKR